MANHTIVHFEIPAANSKEAGNFYSTVFGWPMQHVAEFDYTMFDTGNGVGGGFVTVNNPQNPVQPGDVLIYISTDDIEASLAQIEQAGGKTVSPKMEIPGSGWFAVFTDPTGNKIGLFTTVHQHE